MNTTAIEWCDMTWNPVTGCLHDCPYCYAEKQAKRYNPNHEEIKATARYVGIGRNGLYDITEPWDYDGRTLAHPFGFSPTFHRYRLEEPQLKKKPQNIFVCSMADLFGNWVPDGWIEKVIDVCEGASQHRFLFLTKNPKRYIELNKKGLLPMRNNFWYGTTATTEESIYWHSENHNYFISIEPIMNDFTNDFTTEVQRIIGAPMYLPWVIVGAETGNRKDKIIPERKWIKNIVNQCRCTGTAVFLKKSLAEIWGEPLIQEYPWEKG
jgi:protein gp37